MNKRLIIICGLPGSGKTTLAKQIEQDYCAVRFCPDEWMGRLSINLYDEVARDNIERLQWEIARKVLSAGGNAIIECGTWGRSERDALREEAKAIGASIELHYLKLEPEELFKRIQARAMEDPPITWEMVLKWQDQIQEPDKEEFAIYDDAYVNGVKYDVMEITEPPKPSNPLDT